MTGTEFERIVDWAQQKPQSRIVDVKINNGIPKTWVYDTGIGTGMFVETVDEIDLQGARRRDLMRAVEELAALDADGN